MSFPFPSGHASIVQKIAQSYDTFGILLLDDDDGTIVRSLVTPGQTPSDSTLAILRRWIQGEGRKPISWATLVAVIRDAGFDTLASDITAGLPNLPPT